MTNDEDNEDDDNKNIHGEYACVDNNSAPSRTATNTTPESLDGCDDFSCIYSYNGRRNKKILVRQKKIPLEERKRNQKT